jgi:hypothetical protein
MSYAHKTTASAVRHAHVCPLAALCLQRVQQCNYTSLVTYVGTTRLEQQLVEAANTGNFCNALSQ